MKIVIVGVGDIGFYLAELLFFEKQDIVFIDINQEVFDYVVIYFDVMILCGDVFFIDIFWQADVN